MQSLSDAKLERRKVQLNYLSNAKSNPGNLPVREGGGQRLTVRDGFKLDSDLNTHE